MKRPTKKPDSRIKDDLIMHRRMQALNAKIEAEVRAMRAGKETL